MSRTGGITESDAVRLAQDECSRLGVQWREPFRVKKGWRWWRILTPSNVRGGMQWSSFPGEQMPTM